MSPEEGKPTSYEELLHIIDILPDLVREKRRHDGLSLRQVQDQTGLSFSTIDRFEGRTAGAQLDTAVTLLRWVSS